jgi:hypothetical protein
VTSSKSWLIFASITIRTVFILRLTAPLMQSSPKNEKYNTLASVDFSGNPIAVVYTTCLWLLKQKFAINPQSDEKPGTWSVPY